MRFLYSLLFLALLAYGGWPYFQVWRLDQAVQADDIETLAHLVDLEAVREEIKKRLNKDMGGAVGDVSSSFIDWIQDGIKRMGSQAVDKLVTLEWVRQQLLSKTPEGARPSLLNQLTYAFFDAYDGFLIRIGNLGEDPVHVRMTLEAGGWRVTALYN